MNGDRLSDIHDFHGSFQEEKFYTEASGTSNDLLKGLKGTQSAGAHAH